MTSHSPEHRMLESRVLFLQQSLKQIAQKNVQIEHNAIAIQNKQQYLHEVVENVVQQISAFKNQSQYRNSSLTEVAHSHNSTLKSYHSKQNPSKPVNSTTNSQLLQLFQTLQSHTIKNLEQVDAKLTLSHQQLESKCCKMQLKMLNIWKQAQTLIQNLTFDIETAQLKTRNLQDRISRDRSVFHTAIQSFQDRISTVSHSQTNQFSQSISELQSSFEARLKALSNKIDSLDFAQILESTKSQIHTFIKKNNDKLIEKVTTQIDQTLKNSSTFDSSSKNANLIKKIQRLQRDFQDSQLKLRDLQKQLKDKINPRENWRNKFKQNSHQNTQKRQEKSLETSQKFISLQNSEGPEDPWPSKSIQIASKKPQINKKSSPSNNRLLHNRQSNPLESTFLNKKVQPVYEKEQQKQETEMYGRGIAGLRSMRKKEEEKKSLSRGKGMFDEPKGRFESDLRNPLLGGGNLRQLPGSQSPPRSKIQKGLPPLSSQKNAPKHAPMQRQQGISQNKNYGSSPSEESEGQEQSGEFYVDEEGFLIDKEGNRILNMEGAEIQLDEEEMEKLREQMDGE